MRPRIGNTSRVLTYQYAPNGKPTSQTTEYFEYSALDKAKVEREYARANNENARAFRTSAKGLENLGRGIQAIREAFR